jgi:hypothetical protein
MSKPTEKELAIALKMAAHMRDKDLDPFFIAKALLSHNYRMKYLEDVLKTADRYINLGMAEAERSHLIKAIEKAKDTEAYTSITHKDNFGLE